MTAVSQVREAAAKEADQFSLIPPIRYPGSARQALAAEFGRFLDQTDGVAQPQQLFALLSAFALKCACPWIAYGFPTPDGLKAVRRDSAIMLNYPDEWRQRYLKMGYGSIDPIIKASLKRAGAFRWSDVRNDASTTEDERRILDEAATFGLKSGISVPLRGPDRSLAIMSFARPWDREFPNGTVTYLQLAAFHFHLRAMKVSNLTGAEQAPSLSEREKECILWTARGKSSWEIGVILGISTNTVNFHIKKLKQKLDTPSRTAAAIKAAKLRIIEL
ncbi:LuxR family transcriptional regulator [Mesorhizobium sp. M0757]|uniref:LuxR family transcriptional regulator n=1 Tax=unclassified Mesorhizobium TaxID=325217 RepID=UPI003338CD33